MRKHSEYTRRLCRLYKSWKASASPCLARSIASASETLSPCSFLASVKSPFPAALSQMRRNYLFVVLLAGFAVDLNRLRAGILAPVVRPTLQDDLGNYQKRIGVGQTAST